jgi:hypothetical protein
MRRDRESVILMVSRPPASNNDRNETKTRRIMNWRVAGIFSPFTRNPKAAMRGDTDGDAGDVKGLCMGVNMVQKFRDRCQRCRRTGCLSCPRCAPTGGKRGTPFFRGPLVSSSQEALGNSVLKRNAGGRDQYVSTGNESTRQLS